MAFKLRHQLFLVAAFGLKVGHQLCNFGLASLYNLVSQFLIINLSIYLSIYLSIHLSIHPSIHPIDSVSLENPD